MPSAVVPMLRVPDVRATVMFTAGGRTGTAERRDVDLYVHVEDVAGTARHLSARVEGVEAVHDTFYGMREVAVRDLNGFWITFGQPAAEAGPPDPTG